MRLLLGRFFCLGLLLTSLQSFAIEECPYFTPEQLLTMQRAHDNGESIGMGHELAAIAWQESNAGERLVNKRTKDYGVFQNHLKTVASREGVKPTKHLANRLVKDFDYSAEHAVKELQYWKQVHRKGSMRDVLASYNAGFNVKAGKKYANAVMKKTKTLQDCIDFS